MYQKVAASGIADGKLRVTFQKPVGDFPVVIY
jgi:hypothetical protein